MGVVELAAVAHDDAPAAVGQKQSLVRVEHDRIAPPDAPQDFAAVVAEHEEPAVRSVDVIPQLVLRGDVRQRVQRINHAGVGRARRSDQQPRLKSGSAILLDLPHQACGVHLQVLVHGDVAYGRFAHAGYAQRAEHRFVRLIRHIDHGAIKVLRRQCIARRHDTGEIGR